MTKLSDYVIDFLVQKGLTDIFLVSGGGIMHLVDSVGRHGAMCYYCSYHEQACAISAEAYARVKGRLGVCLVTTGPGSTNALSGVVGAWVDSVPVLVISGQVRRDLIADYRLHRQIGPQEINIIDMAKTVTKYAVTVMDPGRIRYELEAAFVHAMSGRPGPVWVNIPLDVQAALIEGDRLAGYPGGDCARRRDDMSLEEQVGKAANMLFESRRPILICGNGVRLAHAEDLLMRFIDTLKIPVLLTIGGMDLVEETHPHFMGRFGPGGQRRANFALQNADLVISIGASMSVSAIGFNTRGFAPKAKKILVNIDEGELHKPNYVADLAVLADAGLFMSEFLAQTRGTEFNFSRKWPEACELWKKRYPTIVPEFFEDTNHVNSYVFVDVLSDLLDAEDVVLTGNALDAASVYQSFRSKRGQRIFTNINYGAMGWDLPAAVGACIARKNGRTILITGDGSIQFNIQELLTIGYHGLNVKIFVLNNGGYESIRATQKNFFEGRITGADEHSGIGNPDFRNLSAAYGLRYDHISHNGEVEPKVRALLAGDGPVFCEVKVSYQQGRSPKASSYRREDGTMESRPLEDMAPFLSREEIFGNMHLFDEDG